MLVSYYFVILDVTHKIIVDKLWVFYVWKIESLSKYIEAKKVKFHFKFGGLIGFLFWYIFWSVGFELGDWVRFHFN